jgi:hypothetical protein
MAGIYNSEGRYNPENLDGIIGEYFCRALEM